MTLPQTVEAVAAPWVSPWLTVIAVALVAILISRAFDYFEVARYLLGGRSATAAISADIFAEPAQG